MEKKKNCGEEVVKCNVVKQTIPSSDKKGEKGLKWEKPALEDVSGKVMAQPYIRFT